MKKIDVDNWNRKEHFHFFSQMKSPFVGVTANVDITRGYQTARDNGQSVFAFYMHKSMQAVNAIKELKLRMIDGEVYELDKINVGTTIARADNTFGFMCSEYSEDFHVFNERLQREIEAVRNSTGLRLHVEDGRVDLIRHTTIPWISFTSLLHPTPLNQQESIPKISFGKIIESNGKRSLPVSVEAHHGLVDGYHLGLYYQLFEELLNS